MIIGLGLVTLLSVIHVVFLGRAFCIKKTLSNFC